MLYRCTNWQRQTDKHYQNNKSYLLSKEIDTKKSIFASVDQIDRPTASQTERHVQCDLRLIQKRDISTCISVCYISLSVAILTLSDIKFIS